VFERLLYHQALSDGEYLWGLVLYNISAVSEIGATFILSKGPCRDGIWNMVIALSLICFDKQN
jgi:hypothetical protein